MKKTTEDQIESLTQKSIRFKTDALKADIHAIYTGWEANHVQLY